MLVLSICKVFEQCLSATGMALAYVDSSLFYKSKASEGSSSLRQLPFICCERQSIFSPSKEVVDVTSIVFTGKVKCAERQLYYFCK